MTQEQVQEPRRKRLLQITRKAVILSVVFAVGYAAANLQRAHNDKLLQIETGSFVMKTATLIGICRQIGMEHFRSCEYKVEKLHNEIETTDPEEKSKEAGLLISSILIDGNYCNVHLAKYINSENIIPRARLIDGFRHMRMMDDINNLVRTEGELMLWMLDRVNPDYRLTLGHALEMGESGELYANNEVKYYWIAVASGDFESGN